ncbi:hypothetical protein V6124_11885 [Klebsiella pneumoniae]
MTKSTISRERVVALIAEHSYDSALVDALEHLLAAMDSEPHTGDELSNLLWYSQEATCHSDPNYYCEFQRLATPGLIAGIIRELQERRKADSEPVAWMYNNDDRSTPAITTSQKIGNYWMAEFKDVHPLYRHPQPAPVAYSDFEEFWSAHIHPLAQDDELKDFAWGIWSACVSNSQPAPVVPDVMKPTIEAIKRILPTSNPDEYAACIGADMWNACRSAMLQASPVCTCPSGDGSLRWPCPVHPGNSPVIPDCWCRTCRPVVLDDMRFVVCPDCGNKRCPRANDHRNACAGSNEPGQEGSAYPDTPREVK